MSGWALPQACFITDINIEIWTHKIKKLLRGVKILLCSRVHVCVKSEETRRTLCSFIFPHLSPGNKKDGQTSQLADVRIDFFLLLK